MSKTESSITSAGDAILPVNKPLGWTSFDVVSKLRSSLKIKKAGHAGTLDPLATGLLIICTGSKTKMISSIQETEKEYTGTMRLGEVTESFDSETPVIRNLPVSHLDKKKVSEATSGFKGDIVQVPPVHSAVKIDGQRAYHYARKGEPVKLRPRIVTIHEFEITDITMPDVSFRIVCSKGTYIRSLVNDFGIALDSGAYLTSLCRTRVGTYELSEARTIEEWVAYFS